jgi:sugar lactone lactonase YvrE
VTTDGNGNFAVGGDYTCTPGQQVYMVAVGGNPGQSVGAITTTATVTSGSSTIRVASATGITTGMSVSGSGVGGTVTGVSGKNITLSQSATASGTNVSVTFWVPVNNTAIVQMIGLGQCPAAGNLAAQVPYLVINEVTTVAFAYAMGGFGTDAYHIGSSGTALAKTAIANAMANSYNIVGIAWGSALPAANGNSNSMAPQAKINTLADIIATCVNTSSATSTQCTNIFTNAKNSSNVTPTDELTALFNIVQNPDANVAAIWARFPATPVFSPTLSTQPTDWTLPIVYKNVVSSRPGNIAFDSFGNAWISDRSSNAVVRVSPQGTVTKFTNLNNGSSNGSIYEVAVDSGNNVWALDYTYSQIYRLDPTGAWESTITGNQLSAPISISFDSAGDAVVLNSSNTQVSRFSSSGVAQTPAAYNQSTNGQGSLGTPITIASDSAGNVFIPANGGCACVGVLGNTNIAAITYTDWSGTLGNATASAIDGSNHVWQAQTNNTIVQAPTYASNSYQYYDNTFFGFQLFVGYYFDATNFFFGYPLGTITPTTLSNGGLSAPDSVSFDGNGYVWAANAGSSTVSGFNGTTALSTTGFQTGSNGVTYGAAPDLSGNVWTVNSDGTVTQILGLAAPTATPVYPGQIAVKP